MIHGILRVKKFSFLIVSITLFGLIASGGGFLRVLTFVLPYAIMLYKPTARKSDGCFEDDLA